MSTLTPNYGLIVPDDVDTVAQVRADYATNLGIIDNNLGGGGGSGNVDDVQVNGVSVLDPQTHVAEITSYKEVTQAQYDALPSSKLTDGIAYFIKDGGGGSGSGGSFLLMITAETGETVTATKDGTTLTATEVSTGVYEVEVTSAGTWTISDGTNTETVDIGIYTATLSSVPEGSTVLPTDDISIWLACGERTEGYTTLSQVLGDSVCLLALLNNNNANDYLVRSTTWASTITADSSAMSYIGLNNYCANTLLADSTWCEAICNSEYFESVLNVKVPTMTSNTTPEGVVSAYNYNYSNYPWHAFDGDSTTTSDMWASENLSTWIQYKFTTPKKIKCVRFRQFWSAGYQITAGIIKASDDGANFTDVKSFTNDPSLSYKYIYLNSNEDSYSYWRMHITAINSGAASLNELQFYGREDV